MTCQSSATCRLAALPAAAAGKEAHLQLHRTCHRLHAGRLLLLSLLYLFSSSPLSCTCKLRHDIVDAPSGLHRLRRSTRSWNCRGAAACKLPAPTAYLHLGGCCLLGVPCVAVRLRDCRAAAAVRCRCCCAMMAGWEAACLPACLQGNPVISISGRGCCARSLLVVSCVPPRRAAPGAGCCCLLFVQE